MRGQGEYQKQRMHPAKRIALSCPNHRCRRLLTFRPDFTALGGCEWCSDLRVLARVLLTPEGKVAASGKCAKRI